MNILDNNNNNDERMNVEAADVTEQMRLSDWCSTKKNEFFGFH